MNNKKFMSVLTLTILGSTLLAPSVLAAEQDENGGVYSSNGMVKFVPDLDPTEPVDPTKPDTPVDPIDPTNPENPNPQPGTPGPLSIDFASSFDFGENKITNKDEIYYARAQRFGSYDNRPNYVQVSDKRGTNAGWTLKVKQEQQFEAKNTLNNILTGAAISFADSKANSITDVDKPDVFDIENLVPGEERVIMAAKKDTGAGTWLDYWGEVSQVIEKDKDNNNIEVDITKSVTLSVPGSTPKDAAAYRTTLTWTLSDIPGV
ncbi:WxL domain-containing protein [Vagococcus lutrae]|uniref:WxL domain-containing protein n=1 Tax=Vagococcus lutrae TaxID=81947 RepID=UPI000F876A56|nr:WxL domain-containing protein [Vagococcus lutrae]RST93737.1 cell surface protein [Vagococcus lutrae]